MKSDFGIIYYTQFLITCFNLLQAFFHSAARNFNYHDFHSLILMAICDAKYRFIAVDFGASGRRGDGNVFHFCPFGERLRKSRLNIPPPCPADGFNPDQDVPFSIVGDAAFSGNRGIIAPIKGRFRPDDEVIFNYRVSRARRVIENAFGILVARFLVLRSRILGRRALVKSIVLACTALHNFHLLEEESIPPKSRRYNSEGFADRVMRNGRLQEGRWRNEQPLKEEKVLHDLKKEVYVVNGLGKPKHNLTCEEVKEMFLDYFVDNPVPWQWQLI